MTRWRYVPHHRAEEALRLGWLPDPALAGTHHGAHAVLFQWLCCCGREPDWRAA